MKRRTFITLIGGAAAALPFAARAQQRTTLPQIGILDPGLPQHFEAFRRGMRDLNYVEGKSISYIYRSAAGRAEPVQRLASELAALNPDVIVTTSALPVRAVKEATSTIPIVFAALADAITAGAVSNLAHPGGNLTGLSFLNTELSAKRLELLLETLPNIRRIAVLRDLNTPRTWAEATEEAGRHLGAACDLLIGIELLPWFKGRNQCVLFNSQLLATLSTFLSASTFPSPTLPAQTRSSSASSIPPSTRTTSWSHRASTHSAPSFQPSSAMKGSAAFWP
jgi:ABC transporter substrate binding protein